MANIVLARHVTVDKTKPQNQVYVEKAWKYAPFLDSAEKLIPTEYYS